MSQLLDLDIACFLGCRGLIARVQLADGSTESFLLEDDGRARVSLRSAPVWLRLDTDPAGASPELDAPEFRRPASDAKATMVREVFEKGIAVRGSRVALFLTWDGRCHGEQPHLGDGRCYGQPQSTTEGDRFTSWEHIQTASYVGRVASDWNAAMLAGPVEFDQATPLPLRDATATFGDIICLAGDFFAHLDEESATRFAGAWPPLSGAASWFGGDYRAVRLLDEDGTRIAALLTTIHTEGGESRALAGEFAKLSLDTALHGYPLRRYLALASQNNCHFGSVDSRIVNEALALYVGYHELALCRAAAAEECKEKWLNAVVTEAFACHFLTDLFASGHMRVPRRALGERFGVLRGSLSMSAAMHEEDNRLGLWCSTRDADPERRVVWRSFGDGRLLDAEAEVHLGQVQEAVRCSVAEIFTANRVRDSKPMPTERAVDLIPVPLAAGASPRRSDRFPNGAVHTLGQPPNHWPRFVLLPKTGHVGERQGGHGSREYADLEDSAAESWLAPEIAT